MAVLKALRQTPGTLRRNPILFVPPLVLLLFEAPQMILQAIDPLLASVVSLLLSLAFVFVLPFFQGGIIGMADEALDGRTSLRTFVRAGRSSYVPMLVVYMVLVVANFVLGIVAFFAAIPIGFVFFSDGRGGASIALLAIVAGIAAVVGLAYLLFVFLVQFYGQAIVIDGVGAGDSLKHSVSVVRHHLVGTLGYSILVAVFGGVAGAVFAVASTLLSPQSSPVFGLPHLSTAGIAGVVVLVLLFGSLFGGFFGVYSVAFYRSVNPGAGSGGT